MAYFDSPKNRALWDKELAELRKQKEARAKGGERNENTAEQKNHQMEAEVDILHQMAAGPIRERTSYKELLAEEAASIRDMKKERDMTKAVQKETSLDPQINMGGTGKMGT